MGKDKKSGTPKVASVIFIVLPSKKKKLISIFDFFF